MTRRGFSLLEVVLSLTLLAVLALAAVSWTTSMLQRRAASLAVDARAGEIVVLDRLLRTDLMNHDIAIPPMLQRQERIWTVEGRLHVLTRDNGAAEAVYELQNGRLNRTVRPIRAGPITRTSVLLEQLERMTVRIETTEHNPWATLSLTLDHADATTTDPTRLHFEIPAEWAR